MKGMNCLFKLLLCAAGLFLLTACGGQLAMQQNGTLAQALAEGVIYMSDVEVAEIVFETARVVQRDMTYNRVMTVTPQFLTMRHLYFQIPNRELAAVHVERGDRVQAGDLLAELVPLDAEEHERLFIQAENARIELDRFERDFIQRRDEMRLDIAIASNALQLADDDDWMHQALDLNRRDVAYRQFILNSEHTRDNLRRQVENFEETILGYQIIAPFDGVIIFRANTQVGTSFVWSPRMFTIASEESLLFATATTTTTARLVWGGYYYLYRHGAVLPMLMTVPGEDGFRYEFYGHIVNDTRATRGTGSVSHLFAPVDKDSLLAAFAYHEVDLSMPGGPRFYVMTRAQVYDVLAVPSNAIYFTTVVLYNPMGANVVLNFASVYVHDNGALSRRNVEIGVTDVTAMVNYTEIIFGLYEGQEVIIQ